MGGTSAPPYTVNTFPKYRGKVYGILIQGEIALQVTKELGYDPTNLKKVYRPKQVADAIANDISNAALQRWLKK